MLKVMLAGTTALTLLGGSSVYAQQTAPAPTGSNVEQQRPRLTAEERAAFTDARISELKTELHLTAAQEKNWSTFETALRATAKKRAERFEQFRKQREANAPGALRGDRPDFAVQETGEQKQLAAALDPLYKSLDDGQKQRFAAMFRIDGEGRHFWFRGRRNSQNDTN
jgi:zinc resistance-associated protein